MAGLDDTEVEIEIEVETDTTSETDDRDEHHEHETPPAQLADELGRIDLQTTPAGYVESRVTDIESIDERTVRLEVTLPHDRTVTFDLEKPIPWSQEFLLARLVEDVGYDAASIEYLIGERVYLARTDIGEEAIERGWGLEEWWTNSVRTVGNTVLSSLGGSMRLEENRNPEWRLVDPLERVDDDESAMGTETREAIAGGCVLVGTLVAALGAVVAVTGSVVVSSTVVAYALPGIALAVIGWYLLTRSDPT